MDFPTLNCRGKLLTLDTPLIMGILNLTPDSFYDGGVLSGTDQLIETAGQMLLDGADILDLGGASSRPGATTISPNEEADRVIPAIEAVRKAFPDAILSIDTWRSSVAEAAMHAGAHIINDISGGVLEPQIMAVAAAHSAPYILMHMQGTPETMQQSPRYENLLLDILDFFILQIGEARKYGVKDIILDPGFGFGKTTAHNFELLKNLRMFESITELPVLAGLSRKGMIYRTLGITPQEALNGTTALNMAALLFGARILRVHDVAAAAEVRKLFLQFP